MVIVKFGLGAGGGEELGGDEKVVVGVLKYKLKSYQYLLFFMLNGIIVNEHIWNVQGRGSYPT